jgi:hypothetical protein
MLPHVAPPHTWLASEAACRTARWAASTSAALEPGGAYSETHRPRLSRAATCKDGELCGGVQRCQPDWAACADRGSWLSAARPVAGVTEHADAVL